MPEQSQSFPSISRIKLCSNYSRVRHSRTKRLFHVASIGTQRDVNATGSVSTRVDALYNVADVDHSKIAALVVNGALDPELRVTSCNSKDSAIAGRTCQACELIHIQPISSAAIFRCIAATDHVAAARDHRSCVDDIAAVALVAVLHTKVLIAVALAFAILYGSTCSRDGWAVASEGSFIGGLCIAAQVAVVANNLHRCWYGRRIAVQGVYI